MLKKSLIAGGIIVAIGFVAAVVQVVSHRLWDGRVWACYRALGSGSAPLPSRMIVPADCRGGDMMIADLGTPNAAVTFGFRPPPTMWVSYALRTVDYDSYAIEVRQREGKTVAQIHHGSD